MRAAIAIVLFSSAAHADLTVNSAVLHSAQTDACPREPAQEIVCRGHHCDVSRAWLDRKLANLSSVAPCARIVPSFTHGRARGFKLYAVRPGSLFARLLLQNGDRIETINGFDLTSPDKALTVYTRLRAATDFVVEIERRGRSINLDYSIR